MRFEQTALTVWDIYIADELERASKEGWEVLTVYPERGSPNTTPRSIIVLKRPVKQWAAKKL